VAACLAALWAAGASAGTVVRFDTVLGPFDVELYDSQTPVTVANFLAYVDDPVKGRRFEDSLIHRSALNFVIQGGGWHFDGTSKVEPRDYPQILLDPAIVNEPFVPTPRNVRGTIAMARIGGQPNSATNQWFINLADNSFLDSVDGGFTVFGRVLGSGMNVVDAIAALPRFGFLPAWDEAPMRNYSEAEFQSFTPVDGDNVMLINDVLVMADADGDLVPDDGSGSGTAGDAPCGGGQSEGCDDNCPTLANGPGQAGVPGVGNQTNSDSDALGDACDNCRSHANAAASPLPFQTTTGGQLDDDADGYGNPCDADFNQAKNKVDAADLDLFKVAFNKNRNGLGPDCNPSGTAPCDKYDLDNAKSKIDASDLAVFKALFNQNKGPTCPSCPRTCVGDACP
jgi:cyclophilin family peptidyl-prolyl cis-trans isomerase